MRSPLNKVKHVVISLVDIGGGYASHLPLDDLYPAHDIR